MVALQRRFISRALVILGGILTLLWGGALAWLTLPWLLRGVTELAGLMWS